MRSDVKKAVELLQKTDPDFIPVSVYETDEYLVLIDNRIGIPPYLVSKNFSHLRMVEFGNTHDMDIVYKDSVFVENMRGDQHGG